MEQLEISANFSALPDAFFPCALHQVTLSLLVWACWFGCSLQPYFDQRQIQKL